MDAMDEKSFDLLSRINHLAGLADYIFLKKITKIIYNEEASNWGVVMELIEGAEALWVGDDINLVLEKILQVMLAQPLHIKGSVALELVWPLNGCDINEIDEKQVWPTT